ncbi:MAG: glycosyl hydrolase 53 family protein [Erysipelotrichaceae bacterium]|nr:glycosyl hydrolase 53 family protein [Erysipelotrichaceae bacterium]
MKMNFIKGADVSFLETIEANGGRFFDNGEKRDLFRILKDHDFNLIRLRLFNDPYDSRGRSYGAGGCDEDFLIRMAERCRKASLNWMLDFHYSDCWADPGKQTMPKAWRMLEYDQLQEAVYQYTRSVLVHLKNRNLAPVMVAVGNEITNGLLWPVGAKGNDKEIAGLVSAGIRAVREVLPLAKVMIHLDQGGNNELYVSFFDSYLANGGEDFDVIGLSYYPFWHGPMSALKANMDDLAVRYEKDLLVTETSYAFTLEDYQDHEKRADNQRKGMAVREAMLKSDLPYPISKAGQRDYMIELMKLIRTVPEGRGLGFVYWGGECLPVENSDWATEEGIAYMHEKGPLGNEWANQALFDYDGNSLEVLDAIRDH